MYIIARGGNSLIIQGNNKTKVTKLTKINPSKEVRIQRIAANAGLAPRVLSSNLNIYGNTFGPYIYGYNMNKLPNNAISLTNHIKNNKNKILPLHPKM